MFFLPLSVEIILIILKFLKEVIIKVENLLSKKLALIFFTILILQLIQLLKFSSLDDML